MCLCFLLGVVLVCCDRRHSDRIVDAIETGNHKLVKTLIFSGVDVNIESSQNMYPLIVAALKGDIESMRILIDSDANPNIVESDLWSPLMFCSFQGTFDCVKYLLEEGASPYLINNKDMAAAEIALAREHHEVCLSF